MAVRYKNKKTGKIATYAQPMPRLEKSDTWDRVTDSSKSTAKDDGKSKS